VEEDSTKRTGSHALLTGDALFTVNIIDTVLRCDSSSRTVLHAFGNLALSTDNGHPYDRVGVNYHHPNCALLRVVHPEPINGTDQFTNLTSRASLGHDRQLPRHNFLLVASLSLHREALSKPPFCHCERSGEARQSLKSHAEPGSASRYVQSMVSSIINPEIDRFRMTHPTNFKRPWLDKVWLRFTSNLKINFNPYLNINIVLLLPEFIILFSLALS